MLGLGEPTQGISRRWLNEVSFGHSPDTPAAQALRWPRRASCWGVRSGRPLEGSCRGWRWSVMSDTRVWLIQVRWHPRSKSGLQQGVFAWRGCSPWWVLPVLERRGMECPRRELNWLFSLILPFIYPMGFRGGPGRSLGGTWVSPLTEGFTSPGLGWNLLEEVDHVVESPFFQNILWADSKWPQENQ